MSADAFERATTYPYAIPAQSYLFKSGRAHPIHAGDPLPDLEGRTPVLAVGSNQSPQQLARKFPGSLWRGKDGEIPVIRCAMQDFDSVYSPHIASYGSIAATLQHVPGVTVTLFVTWLTDRQLVRMHETEVTAANYGFGRLDGVIVRAEIGPDLETVYLYNSKRGTLCLEGKPIALSEVSAEGRSGPAMSQTEVLHHVRRRLAPEHDLEAFVHHSVEDADLRRSRTEALKDGAKPFHHPRFTEIAI